MDENSFPSRWDRRRRTLHIIDIENLVGHDHALGDRFAFEHALASYAAASQMKAGDQVMVGCHPGLAFIAQNTLGSRGQIFTGQGTDGADEALLAAADVAFIARRYHLVSIGSGDHIFVELAGELLARGVQVMVVARPERLSGQLRDTVARVEFLDDQISGAA
ncbi:MAG: hypothetical protein V3V01_14485 [Acidimicrobiales bacterium]